MGFGALLVVYVWLQAFDRKGRAIGTVTKIEKASEPGELDSPVVTFRVEGRNYSFSPGMVLWFEAKKKRIGMQVRVAYNPNDPSDAEIASAFRSYFGAIVVTLVYGGFIYFTVRD